MISVSIIVPVYNAEAYLEKCLESLFKQTLASVEFIFIEDRSTDNSYARLLELIDCYPYMKDKVKVFQMEQNSGVANVRNFGLSEANGDFVGWVDADDWIEESMFEVLYNQAIQDKADIVWCDYINVVLDKQFYISQYVKQDGLSCIRAMINGELLGGMCNKLVRKELYSNYKVLFPANLNMCEDMRVNVQLFYYASRISYVNFGGYYYVKHKSDSISTKAIRQSKVNYEWIENVKGIIEFIEKQYPDFNCLEIDKFKLEPKRNLLVEGRDLENYRLWKTIFPEANYSIKYTDYPIYYKLLGYAINKGWWWYVRLWMFLKYKLMAK